MNAIGALMKSAYKPTASIWENAAQNKRQEEDIARKSDLRMKIKMLDSVQEDTRHNIYDDLYGSKAQTSKTDTAQPKALKYSFKNLSSMIMRSKTSYAAKQAASQAGREVQRLKKEKQTGKYDPEEIEAAIAHARSMERIARKKANHLLEEEMAKAAGGQCMGAAEVDEEKIKDSEDDANPEKEQSSPDGETAENAPDADAQAISGDYNTDMEQISEMQKIADEMLGDLSEDLEEMMEDLEELSDSFMSVERDMDPADLDAMKLKHRLKEMKEMAKADGEYLKAMFEHYESMKEGSMPSAASMPVSSSPIASMVPTSVAVDVAL